MMRERSPRAKAAAHLRSESMKRRYSRYSCSRKRESRCSDWYMSIRACCCGAKHTTKDSVRRAEWASRQRVPRQLLRHSEIGTRTRQASEVQQARKNAGNDCTNGQARHQRSGWEQPQQQDEQSKGKEMGRARYLFESARGLRAAHDDRDALRGESRETEACVEHPSGKRGRGSKPDTSASEVGTRRQGQQSHAAR